MVQYLMYAEHDQNLCSANARTHACMHARTHTHTHLRARWDGRQAHGGATILPFSGELESKLQDMGQEAADECEPGAIAFHPGASPSLLLPPPSLSSPKRGYNLNNERDRALNEP